MQRKSALSSRYTTDSIPTDNVSGTAPATTRPWLPEYEIEPEYPVAYGPCSRASVIEVLERIQRYLDSCTPPTVVRRTTGETIRDFNTIDRDADVATGAFRLICYEWGVTYSAMLHATEATGDSRYLDYAAERLQFITNLEPYFRDVSAQLAPDERRELAFRGVLSPRNLDDAGSLCAAMIKAERAGALANAGPLIDRFVDYIMHHQFRLRDGTLARNRPVPRSLWLDDLYMSVPALAQMGARTGNNLFFSQAAQQVEQFASRMFDPTRKLYMHGWIEDSAAHPAFHWGRSNGWALLAKVELLDVMPEEHEDRPAVLELLRRHIRGLAERQSGRGLWHQLLDRNDSYLETSASAIFVYCIARAINRGWIDALAYGPAVQLGWNAVAAQVNAMGQVEGTCVGSGMALDPMFYYYRPTSPFAAHGYGPTLLAASEMVRLIDSKVITMHDSAVHFGEAGEEA